MSFIPKVFGKFPKKRKRVKKIKKSPNYYLGRFHNTDVYAPVPYWQLLKMAPRLLFGSRKYRQPHKSLPVIYKAWDVKDEEKFWWSWIGHSSVVVGMDGTVIAMDPMLGRRAAPFKFMGPKRFHPAPEQIYALKKIDAVIISHDHYDHLDYGTVKRLAKTVKHWVVPLGIGEHLEYWGIKPDCVHELDWWDTKKVGNVTITAAPAQHASGRWTGTDNKTLWASWVLEGENEKVFYSGDSGFYKEWAQIGDRFGEFDVCFIQAAAYNRLWKYHHMTPDQVVETHKLVNGKLLVPVHWSTFDLAMHKWYEPAVKLKRITAKEKIKISFPIIGKQQYLNSPHSEPFWWEDYLPGK